MQSRLDTLPKRLLNPVGAALVLGAVAGLSAVAVAQAPPDNVHWSAALAAGSGAIEAGSGWPPLR